MRAPLVFLLLAALAQGACSAQLDTGAKANDPGPGSGGGGSGSGGSPTGGGSQPPNTRPPEGGKSDGGAPGAITDGGASMSFCARLLPISAPSFQDLPAAAGFKLRVRVQAGDPTAPPTTWRWTVIHGDGAGTIVPVTALDPLSTEVELPIDKPGQYQIAASAEVRTVPCTASVIAFATEANRRLGQFRVRLTPPAGPFPAQETRVQVMAGMPLDRALMVQQGQPVTFQPRNELGTQGIASYVRVSQLGSTLAVEGHTANADFRPPLLASSSYDVLVVPDEEVAPWVALGQMPAALNVLSMKLSPGAALTGKLLDGAGAPLRDGRVILRAGALTSTVGASAASGEFTLRVRAGQFAISISPPPARGLPELTVPADSGLTIGEAAAAGALEVKWASVNPAPVGLVVSTASGGMAAGARLRLEGTAPRAAAGTMSYTPPGGDPVTRPMAGVVRVTGQVRPDGSTNLPSVPPGSYRLLITPSEADLTSALTTVALEVPAGGISGRSVRLAGKIELRGTLMPADAVGARVYAVPQEADPPRPAAVAVVGAGGAYRLEVDPGRDYVIWADPGLGKPFARAQLARLDDVADGAEVPARTLPRALPFTATLLGDANGLPLATVVVQVYCQASGSCLDPNIVLAEGVTDRMGRISLSLPDPGSF